MNQKTQGTIHQAVIWLRLLIYICIANMASVFVNMLPFVPVGLTTWISRGLTAAMILCTYKLAAWNERYQKATIFRGVMLAGTLAGAFLAASAVFSLVTSVCSLVSVYQEYSAHAELIASRDSGLSDKWHSLFLWNLAAGLVTSFGAMAVVLLMSAAMQSGDTPEATTVMLLVLTIPQTVVNLCYIWYLRKMTVYLSDESEENHDQRG